MNKYFIYLARLCLFSCVMFGHFIIQSDVFILLERKPSASSFEIYTLLSHQLTSLSVSVMIRLFSSIFSFSSFFYLFYSKKTITLIWQSGAVLE